MKYCGAKAYIDIDALRHNLQQVRKYAPNSKVISMIKANAYGHGLLEVANILAPKTDAFGVACLDEGLLLREACIKTQIIIMTGFRDEKSLKTMSKYNLEAVIHCKEQLDILQKVKLKKPIFAWLKIDTGMHRLGFLPEQALKVYAQLEKNENIHDKLCVLTHFSDADDLSKSVTKEQLKLFLQTTANISVAKSIAASGGILGWPQTHADWVRPGIMLYGVSPLVDTIGEDFDLRPVMMLQSYLIAIKKLRKNDSVGYGGIWRCPEDMNIGIVAIGYGDGYPRHAKSGTPVLINNEKSEVIGRVSMDMIAIDLRSNPTAKCGDIVTLWGSKDLPIEHVAKCANTISYQLFCNLTQRVEFIYK